MKHLLGLLPVAFIAVACSDAPPPDAAQLAPAAGTGGATPGSKPRLEVVFAIDTTGSMTNLIEGTKAKVWSIARVLASGKPTPDIAIGFVAYRDRGDAYVTKLTPLSTDLDLVYKDLMALRADGGGDGPEHVNQALVDATEAMAWSGAPRVTRIIFLVGDAPPHMDYTPDTPWMTSVEAAVKKGIVVNTIRCGGDETTAKVFSQISRRGQGRFVSLAQDGGMVVVATPQDEELARLRSELASTYVTYGAREEREARMAEKTTAETLPEAPSAAADRAATLSKTGAALGERDLVADAAEGRVDFDALPDVELPDDLAAIERDERKAKLEEIASKRSEIENRIALVARERDAYLAKTGAVKADSFDAKVLAAIRDQAARNGIRYE